MEANDKFPTRKNFQCEDKLCDETENNVMAASQVGPPNGSTSGQIGVLACHRDHFIRRKDGPILHQTNTSLECIYRQHEGKLCPLWVDSLTKSEVECDDQCKNDTECRYRGNRICVDGR